MSKLLHTASEIAALLKRHIETASSLIVFLCNVLKRLLTQSRSTAAQPLVPTPTVSGTGEDVWWHG